MDKDSPAKRLVIDTEKTIESDHEAEANEPAETSKMQFENDAGPSVAGGTGSGKHSEIEDNLKSPGRVHRPGLFQGQAHYSCRKQAVIRLEGS